MATKVTIFLIDGPQDALFEGLNPCVHDGLRFSLTSLSTGESYSCYNCCDERLLGEKAASPPGCAKVISLSEYKVSHPALHKEGA